MNEDPIPLEDDPTVFPDDELDDDTNSSSSAYGDADVDAVPDADSTSDDSDTELPPPPINHDTAIVTVAVPSSVSPPPSPPPLCNPVTFALPRTSVAVPKPIDDSRRLFQRLWTDEDEIELLQGFLDYNNSRGVNSSGHHYDTSVFYDQIKCKLQLDFNKNQLVEKLRRLKKKYRTVLSKMASGKEFVFKSPHDQATFELAKKIWTNVSGDSRGGSGGGGGVVSNSTVEFDDDERNSNPNLNYNAVTVAAATPPRPTNNSFVTSHINLNSSSGGSNSGRYEMMMTNSGGIGGGLPKLSMRKRPRATVGRQPEERLVKNEILNLNDHIMNNMKYDVNKNNNVNLNSPMQGLVEETLRNCLSPVLKDLITNTVNGAATGGGNGGFKGVAGLAMNALPLNFPGGCSNVEGMNEKWKKQQVLELEVYSKRLELVQEQIKLSLEELRSSET